jgi:hypothetical protein
MVKKNPNATLTADIELTPERCEYVGADEVLVSLKTKTGDARQFYHDDRRRWCRWSTCLWR